MSSNALRLAALLLLGGLSAAHAETPGTLKERDGVWAQSYSDVKPDPAVRFGQLPNGMMYAIMHNATPPHQVALRLRIDAGSRDETDAQQGLAHFLEHMAFKGSAHVPENELVKMLERLGLAFGADTNASTGFDETIFKFDLPEADAAHVDTGLMLMRETASELTLSQGAMDSERGVILSEERLRDTPDERTSDAGTAFELPGQLAPTRFPIGKVDVIKTAPVSQIAAFYHANYRPDRAALVVVGDIDVDAIEAKIKTLFADWTVTAPAAPRPALGTPAARHSEARVAVVPGATPQIEIAWVKPYDDAADTLANRRRDLIIELALSALRERLEDAARRPVSPFQTAAVWRWNKDRSALMTELAITPNPGGWRDAVMVADTVRRQALAGGLTQDEVAAAIARGRTGLERTAARAATRQTPTLASEIARAVDENIVFSSPVDDLAMYDEATKGLTAEQLTTALRGAFAGAEPIVFMASPDAIPGGDAALLAALNEAEAAPVAAGDAEADKKVWTHQDFGPKGTVATRKEIADLGVTFITFANGARLTVKPTNFVDHQILVTARFGHGMLDLPKDGRALGWTINSFPKLGLTDLSARDIDKLFNGKQLTASLRLGPDDDALSLHGETRPADLATQMQLLTAYFTAPGFRAQDFEFARSAELTATDQASSTAEGALVQSLSTMLRSDDPRWAEPDHAQVAAAHADDVKALLQGPLSTGPIEVTMVGDVTVEQAIDVTAATFGALPPRPEAPPVPAEARAIKFPAPVAQPVLLSHTGRADQAIALMAWPADDFISDLDRARAAQVMGVVLENRLIDQFRIKEGETYSPGAQAFASRAFPHYGYIFAHIESPPDKLPGFFTETARIAADLRDNLISPDELDRAKVPLLERLKRSFKSNGLWVQTLSGAQADPTRLDRLRSAIPGVEKIGPAEVRDAAATYLAADKAWKVMVLPRSVATREPVGEQGRRVPN